MRKHRNTVQDNTLLAFMKKHGDISKIRGASSKALWIDLAAKLNRVGPPTKSGPEWRRVWKDWKTSVRKKIVYNKMHTRSKLPLKLADNSVAMIADLMDESFEASQYVSIEQPSTSENEQDEWEDIEPPPNKSKLEEPKEQNDAEISTVVSVGSSRSNSTSSFRSIDDRPDDFDKTVLTDIVEELRELNKQNRSNAELMLAMGANLIDMMQQQIDERKRFTNVFQKYLSKLTDKK
ncbi:CG30428 [Drosophila busckii]|uniref:Regulatory protein zeste n=1 Tax=Drosophila busckii TaxID=30019 RepID=A0A0M3QTM3_DROBS|nr:uncharacterized protein LOC108608344 [Drosophila busckii]ALC39163.1 CG30428 [Drosophila busckii]